jgi:hypothetical protein
VIVFDHPCTLSYHWDLDASPAELPLDHSP